ncbi:MAG TPA: tRNA (N6-isopentenyl adenosine(37)-C2)-methylthiotransferase MiaB [Candidatus Marinimicrobia bacterium]|jgi:tRNA-2-methylthio-N6-dimethylallyladenosine synthase|nr:tRNA (N6-isopentenyl adenosine(37)-C2)-methylthiotransferase MiaB [Candidatus Neomarinimicrobiota bacterium]HIB72259.1 tRNA (N6-isopentenyl adenosine(37)-C2)-methylthiotransferase MiaB [Candidatus Neomarinimicrobiota bacterium]HIB95167.1 tRNA (N6-isopentenyl adenosine(37)-C2)-methylthiotransferase MiaB [Candidatus Neomarinimicrobiota bacterium]HIN62412.1 tRNA (N6-isopentenyl adenosine(37)-C2)-methylthiotransferase MiaB [Candidatus Neomarinimicrobiota bacterium]HIO35821.1 tRNA (N6-isopentenyl
MKRYYIETYGCQMNVADSELVASMMEKSGFARSDSEFGANAVFLNTCAIREHAEDKIHSRLGKLRKLKNDNPEMIIGIMGCMAQHVKDNILENKPYVDFVLGPDSYRRIPELLRRHEETNASVVDTRLSRFEVYENLYPSRQEGINAWVSIMRGCDKFCTFCIVPFTRGRERSCTVESVVEEVQQTVDQGFVEITLLGQNVNSYRHGDARFPELLDAVAQIPGVMRIRFTSPHPQDIDDDMLFVMRDHANICNSVHLPLQAGAERILKRMNRTYTQAQFLALSEQIRNILPGCGISTDIIAGFPGETEEEFGETLAVMEKVKFDSAFTFKYSSRPGTKAAEYSDQIPEKVKKDRLAKLVDLQYKHTLFRNRKEIGKKVKVLVEKESKKSSNEWAGRTDNNKWVIFPKESAEIRDLVDVKIVDAQGVSLFGEIIQVGKESHAII